MKEQLQQVLKHKSKFAIAFLSCVFFLLVLFPYNDLSDLVTQQVSKFTNNRVYLQFSALHPSLFPQPGLELEGLKVETPTTPQISADRIVFTPSVWGAIQQKPSGTVKAYGFLNGSLKLSVSPGKKTEDGNDTQAVVIEAEKLNLSQLRELTNLPVNISGQVSLNSNSTVDLSFGSQPDVSVELRIERFELPPANVETLMGPLTLPDLKLSNVNLRGRLSAGRLVIEEGRLGGSPQDEITGDIKGNIALNLRNTPAGIQPILGAYSFDINLNIKPSFEEKSKLFLSFIDSFKKPATGANRYSFKVQGTSPMVPPNFSALR